MKKLLICLIVFTGLFFILLSPSCKKDKQNEEEKTSFDEAAQKSYEKVLALQDQSLAMFNSYLATLDSSAAKESLATWFRNDAAVEWAKVGSQGVMVKYVCGICGGLVVNFERGDEAGKSMNLKSLQNNSGNVNLKGLPTKKKAVILASFYDSWGAEVDQEFTNWNANLGNDGFSSTSKYTLSQISLDKLTTLNDYGIIDFNTHGIAWPDNAEIEEVLLLSREQANNETTKKYWDDIREDRVAIFELPTGGSVYAVKPSFITKYNDFKNDTILFYGGFCYSYLGTWPQIVNSCAAGAYVGFDWSVDGPWATYWACNIITLLSDKSVTTPMNLEQWLTSTPEVPKLYFSKENNRNIHINYNGYGGITLWKPANPANGGIIATTDDGSPILKTGFTCTDYVLKCNLPGQLSSTLGYEWDYGDGSATYYTVNDNLSLRHSWSSEKPYNVKVTVTDYSTNTVIKEFKTVVRFIDPGYLPQLKALENLTMYFGPDENIHLSSGTGMYVGYFNFDTQLYSTQLTWTDSSFYARNFISNNNEIYTIQGNVSSDGRVLKHALFNKTYSYDNFLFYDLNLEVTNLPIVRKDTLNCIVNHLYDNTGSINQAYVTRAEFKTWDNVSGSYITISGIDWPVINLDILFRNDN